MFVSSLCVSTNLSIYVQYIGRGNFRSLVTPEKSVLQYAIVLLSSDVLLYYYIFSVTVIHKKMIISLHFETVSL